MTDVATEVSEVKHRIKHIDKPKNKLCGLNHPAVDN